MDDDGRVFLIGHFFRSQNQTKDVEIRIPADLGWFQLLCVPGGDCGLCHQLCDLPTQKWQDLKGIKWNIVEILSVFKLYLLDCRCGLRLVLVVALFPVLWLPHPRISSGPTPTQSQYCLLFAGLLRNENVFRVRSMAPNPPFYLPLHSGYSVDLRVHVDRDGVWAAGWKIRSGLQSWYERRSPRFTDFYCFLTIKPWHILGQQTQSKCQPTTETFLGVTLLNLRNGRSAIF